MSTLDNSSFFRSRHNRSLHPIQANGPYFFRIPKNFQAPLLSQRNTETKVQIKSKEESSVSSLNRVNNSMKSLWGRVGWTLILIVTTILCSYQVSQKIYLYQKHQTMYQLKVEINHTVSLPAITVCTEGLYGSMKLKQEFAKEKGIEDVCSVNWLDLVGYKEMDVEQVWKSHTTKHYLEEYKLREAIILEGERTAKTTTLPTILGYCETLDFSDIVFKFEYGYITYMRLILKKVNNSCDYSGIKIRVHSPTDSLRHTISRQSLQLFVGIYADLIVDYQKVIQISTPENPCVDEMEHNYCIDKCLDEKLNRELNCRLPFMNSNLPFCKDKESAKQAFEQAQNIYNRNPDCTHCSRPCVENKYMGIISPFATEQKGIEMGIYYNTNMFQTATEVYVYDLISCLCDIAGNLGLFLGLCLIHLLDLFDCFMIIRLKKIKNVNF